MDQSYVVRPFHPADVERIVEIHHRSIHATNQENPLYTSEELAQWSMQGRDHSRILQSFDGHPALVAQSTDGSVVGFGDIVPQEDGKVILRRLYVDPAVHGKGVGRKLISDLEFAACSFQLRTMKLFSALFPPTIRFYLSRGYSGVQLTKQEIRGVSLHVYEMEKKIQLP